MINDCEENPYYNPHLDDETLSLGGTIAKLDVNIKIISKMIVGF